MSQVDERRVRDIHEGVYQASAQSYRLSPTLVGTIGPRRVQDELSLGYLLHLIEDVQSDLAGLGRGAMGPDRSEAALTDLPTVAVSGEIRLPPGGRAAFLADLRSTLQELFTRHGGATGDTFKLAVACLTDEAALRIWLAEHAEVAIPEGRFEFWGRHTSQSDRGHHSLVTSEPDRLLQFTWRLDERTTTVEIVLEPVGGDETALRLRQDGMPSFEELMNPPGRRDGCTPCTPSGVWRWPTSPNTSISDP